MYYTISVCYWYCDLFGLLKNFANEAASKSKLIDMYVSTHYNQKDNRLAIFMNLYDKNSVKTKIIFRLHKFYVRTVASL